LLLEICGRKFQAAHPRREIYKWKTTPVETRRLFCVSRLVVVSGKRGTPGQTVKEFHISPAAEGGGESVAGLLVPKPLPLACTTPKNF
jgi:hypothetical protein